MEEVFLLLILLYIIRLVLSTHFCNIFLIILYFMVICGSFYTFLHFSTSFEVFCEAWKAVAGQEDFFSFVVEDGCIFKHCAQYIGKIAHG